MSYQVNLTIRGAKVKSVCIDSMLILDKDSLEVYAVRQLEISPLKPGGKKYAFGTNTLPPEQAKPGLYYHTKTQNILGTNFYKNTTVTVGTNTGKKHVLWTENKYIFKIYGTYITNKGKTLHFEWVEPLYLYFDSPELL